MENYMTLYCIRQKSTGYYLPIKSYGLGNTTYAKMVPTPKAMPRFFSQVTYARATLVAWIKSRPQYYPERNIEDFEIVPVYVTISKLNVDDIAELDNADAGIKQRIKDLGLVHLKGGQQC